MNAYMQAHHNHAKDVDELGPKLCLFACHVLGAEGNEGLASAEFGLVLDHFPEGPRILEN